MNLCTRLPRLRPALAPDAAIHLLPTALLLLSGCESTVVVRPQVPADQVVLVADSTLSTSLIASLTQSLGASVSYLGRSEEPLRVTRRDCLDADLVRQTTLLAVVHGESPAKDADDALAALRAVAPVETGTSDAAGTSSWSTYEDVPGAQQTIVVARISGEASITQASRLGQAMRASLERSQVRHRRRQLRSTVGARMLPDKATRGLFRVLVPAGYAWSDTSRGWPHSVQIAAPRPTRVVTVFWLEDAADSWLQSREFLVGMLRDAMWRLQGDRLAEDSVEWLPTPDGTPELLAVWQNPDRIAGGPMLARFVYDRARQRLYGVQALVFLPGADKHRALQEAIALASTFEIVEPF